MARGNCQPGEIVDCKGNCAPQTWVNDGYCDDGRFDYNGNYIFLNCPEFDCDDCGVDNCDCNGGCENEYAELEPYECGKCCWPDPSALSTDNCQIKCSGDIGSKVVCEVGYQGHWVPFAGCTCIDGEECSDCTDNCGKDCGACCYTIQDPQPCGWCHEDGSCEQSSCYITTEEACKSDPQFGYWEEFSLDSCGCCCTNCNAYGNEGTCCDIGGVWSCWNGPCPDCNCQPGGPSCMGGSCPNPECNGFKTCIESGGGEACLYDCPQSQGSQGDDVTVCELLTWDECNEIPNSTFHDGKKCIQIDANTSEEYNLCDTGDGSSSSTTTTTTTTTTSSSSSTTPPPDNDCEDCPKEIACVEWVGCSNRNEPNQLPGINLCRQCMVLPRGASEKLNGMAVNSACDQWSKEVWGCSVSGGNVDSNQFEACMDGGRYKVTKITNCNNLPEDANDFGDAWAYPNAVCSFKDTICQTLGDCKTRVYNEENGEEWFPADGPIASSKFSASCGEAPLISNGCCEDYDETEWFDWTWEEDTGCHACAHCQTVGVDCTTCDGCNDITSECEPCEACRLPADCGSCWTKDSNDQMGMVCVDRTQQSAPNGKETHCSSGDCSQCVGVNPAADPDCPCHYACDCIEGGKSKGDWCCAFDDDPIDMGGGVFECPVNSQYPNCTGHELGSVPHTAYNPRVCECLRCGSESGNVTSFGVCCIPTSQICDDNNNTGYTLEECNELGGTLVESVFDCGVNDTMCMGACCVDGFCVAEMSEYDCGAFEGIFQGIGIFCDDIVCSNVPGGGNPEPVTTTTSPGYGLELISTPAGCVWMMNPSSELPRCP